MKRKSEVLFVALFVGFNLTAPLLLHEKFPFTISPMFCDQPDQYATYEVFDPEGNSLPQADFGLHLVYDGNPPGLGMGIQPRPTVHAFGECSSESEIRSHVSRSLSRLDKYEALRYVVIHRHEVHCEHCQLVRCDTRWKVDNPRFSNSDVKNGEPQSSEADRQVEVENQ